jgi:hypothetical protein
MGKKTTQQWDPYSGPLTLKGTFENPWSIALLYYGKRRAPDHGFPQK